MRALLSQLPAGRSFVSYSRPSGVDRPGVDYTVSGRFSPERIRSLEPPPDADAYICGPSAFMRDMTGALDACGLSSSRIRTEVFGATSAVTPGVVTGSARAPHQPYRSSRRAPGTVRSLRAQRADRPLAP